ncbi:universal stress protein UspA [Paenibacillus selenitireducens]|jgi:nucleotide-binding universal stress UspA family protein|uniref:Universal stress protein UspA n=1 Tax=Paenibacillus selenitireducens TaxID=1324314 RepID=A0A1T2X0J0_9BACL|nr:universal stress protein [Paenibacillus selenitireducens]OPA73414.1 universal stress protein UspA [Paenibacillus selenitireducens]
MLFSKVLVPYDGSPQSKKALETAKELIQLNPNAKLEVLHVYDYMRMYMADSMLTVPSSVNMEQFELAEQMTEDARKLVATVSNETHVEMRQGSPAKTILDYAKEVKCDFIVIGCRGLGAIGEMVLGSVSHNVVQHARVPVLVVK